MTEKQKTNIIQDIQRMIPDIARKNGIYNDEIKLIINSLCAYSDDFTIITWPDIQEYMDKEGFKENCCLANSEEFINIYGSSAYFVNKNWLNKLQ